MFETLLDLFRRGKIDEKKLDIAVTRGWISRMQKIQILCDKERE